eukprot:CAMPEP_0175040986 /NCGR_PEP_ID=MMETSP0052_2-20121109/1630_1 /TAXON_ID=51329 ORGANISM="Polytomella parva, Strain SAG 63-3" /NCGR_SAMPLE_ID=MMETSP0052_2 /ASSEMBLY_ACC=CAM_ASM_000194 /LENGTH=401 /DNA_ID=CAMNT_0016303383 /DNA_START=57 /DNA_END=1262 /DNA_ORIENTATION=-
MSRYAARPGEEVPPIDEAHRKVLGPIEVPQRILMGPGPSNAHPRILNAQSLPLLGHMHPPFLKIMDDIQEGLRYLFQTNSKYTLLISGTGHNGMEASIANLIEPGETILIGTNGIWGERVATMAERYGANVVQMKVAPGGSFSQEDFKKSLAEHKPAVLFLVQGESSTGVHQSLAGVGDLCHEHGTLLVVDSVASLGGVPFFADKWGVDCSYSGSQKCLSAPPGAAPFMLSERAFQKVQNRKVPPQTYALDINLIGDYWGWFNKRFYHHTGPISTFYALREALTLVAEEGLENMWKRHQDMATQLWEGLSKLGLEPYPAKEEDRIITVNTVKVPEGVDWAALIKNAMDTYSVELSGGLGPSVGKVWRVGVMGYNARPQNIELVIAAFRDGLQKQGKLPLSQ